MVNSILERWSLIKLCVGFFLLTVVLFLTMVFLVILPKIDQIFIGLNNQTTKVTAKAHARELNQYLHARNLVLQDMSSNTLIVNANLMGDSTNPAFLDYIQHTTLLNDNPHITIIDAVGEVLYSELSENNDYEWVLPVLHKKVDHLLRIIEDHVTPQVEIAVPIKYGKSVEGVLVGRVNASPETVYGQSLFDDKNVIIYYSMNGKRIQYGHIESKQTHSESVALQDWGLDFVYTVDYRPASNKSQELTRSFIVSTTSGALVLFFVLFWVGRRIILMPFHQLINLQSAISSAVEGISLIDTKGHYISLNNSYARTCGYACEDLVGKCWTVIICHEDLSLVAGAYQKMLTEGKSTIEARGIKKDGDIFYNQITMICQHDKIGGFIGHHCFLKDISERKEVEEKIRKKESELQLIFDNVPVKIWYKDDKNKIIRLNKKAAESMGGTVKEFEGKNTYDLFPEMAKKYHDDDLSVIKSQTELLNIVERYTPISGPGGWVSSDKIPYDDPVTHEKFLFVCSQDITLLKNSELEQGKLVDQLSMMNKELEQFAYVASHDLKAPLRGIEQLADWVFEDCTDLIPAESKKHLNLMVNRVKRMGGLLDDLLDYAHISHLDLTVDEIDLKEIFNAMLDLYVQPFGFSYKIDVPNEKVRISRKPLEIVIRNLLDNAVKHHDKENGHIEIKYKHGSKAHLIDVIDDGPGIHSSMHEKAFKMFQTLKPRDDVEGSGMGLSIIKKILQRYDGTINIDSDGERGTTFKIYWPYSK